jgi:ubiquinone/menaquinone biosynthesis C-methylase UbiE
MAIAHSRLGGTKGCRVSAVAGMTARRYQGGYAQEYEAKRVGQERWAVEDQTVRDMLGALPPGTRVLDVPFGTGRFIPFYREKRFSVLGLDINPDMLREAALKAIDPRLVEFRVGDILAIDAPDKSFDVALAVRILNLIDRAPMQTAVRELQRVARSTVVFTLRIGDDVERGQRHRKHSMTVLEAAILPGWKIEEVRLIHRNAWHMVRLRRVIEPQPADQNG